MDRPLHILILIIVIAINILAIIVLMISYKKLKSKMALLEDDERINNLLIKKLPLDIDEVKIKEKIKGKICLITGGGGTIGSELSKQIASLKPERLIILDIYENNAYRIQQYLLREFTDLNLDIEIGSIRDHDKMDKLFKKYNPDIIFHAAAHKHVPLMENSPDEAIKNNIGGTLNMVELADKYRTEEFVLISTDKAANPTSIMGATKLCSEMIAEDFARRGSSTKFLTVRFGNVIGSSGSIIPLFKEQILNGGPLTLTDPDVERYFMSTSEAVMLVLQSTIYDEGTFILDMGTPVKIADLAENMISLFGDRPNRDIKIKYIGLRPGEKLYEEYTSKEEELEPTEHDRIYKVRSNKKREDALLPKINQLIQSAQQNAPANELKEMLNEIINM
ncbi:MAG: polysaccharide biosynthesis protein [Clostridiales bacterium]|nr:polysaccharide biosynthesis protein [Clostridiales bacterium]